MRTIIQWLGDGTWPYQVARYTFKSLRILLWPVLAPRRKWRAAHPRAVAPQTAFPFDYLPQPFLGDASCPPDVTVWTLDAQVDATDVTVRFAELPPSTEFLCLVSPSDGNLNAVAAYLRECVADHDVAYADEDGRDRHYPVLKTPHVGPHSLWSYDVIGRPVLIRVSAIQRLGGFSPESGHAFERDLYLRLRAANASFLHVPVVLPGGRRAHELDSPTLAEDSASVVARDFTRRGLSAHVSPGDVSGVTRWTLDPPSIHPRIDIVIPTRDRIDLVRRCIDSVEKLTTYDNWSIILLDNDSVEDESRKYFATTKYQVVPCPGPFNYAKIVNRGIAHSTADFIVTLNNDTILLTPDWLEQMVGMASLPDVGIVGGRLIDQHGHGEHEGIVISPFPQHFRTASNYPHRDAFSASVRDISAVTGAVQMCDRQLWNELGGMDELLTVTMNDVDICLRALTKGRYTIYTPHVELTHYVSSSRGNLDPKADRNRFISRWDIFGDFQDPFFPAALRLLGERMFYRPPTTPPTRQ